MTPTQSLAAAQLKHRAKAFAAGAGTLVAGELILVISDASIQSEVAHVVPPAWAFLVPFGFAIVNGIITHQIPNKALAAMKAAAARVPLPGIGELTDDPA